MEIEWRTIEEFPKYEVSNCGDVRNSETGAFLKIRTEKRPFSKNSTVQRVYLWDGKLHGRLVGRLVAQAFVPNPDNLPELEHINGDFHDNRAENLRWTTHDKVMKNEHIKKYIFNGNKERTKNEVQN